MKSATTDADRKFHLNNATQWQEVKDSNWATINAWLKKNPKAGSIENEELISLNKKNDQNLSNITYAG